MTRSRARPAGRSPAAPERATFTAIEVAALLGLSRNAVYQAAERGEIPGCRRIGRRVVFARAPLLAWLGQECAPPEE